MSSLPFVPSSFEVQPISSEGYSQSPQPSRFTNEAEALAFARSQVSPIYAQVTTTAHGPGTDTFALCHCLYRGKDSDWRTWVGGKFVGGFPLHEGKVAA